MRPGRRPVRGRVRLLERQRMVRVERATDLDLGDGPGAGGRLVDQPGRQRADRELGVGHSVVPGERHGQQLQRERPTRARRRVRRDPDAEVRRDDERAGPDRQERARPPVQAMRERVVGQRPVRVDAGGDDLGHRVRLDDVDPLEGRDDRVLGRPEGRRRRRQPDVGATLGGQPVGRAAELGERALAAGRGGLDDPIGVRRPGPAIAGRHSGTSWPASWSRSASSRPTGTSMRRTSTPGGDQLADLVERALEVGLREGRADPRSRAHRRAARASRGARSGPRRSARSPRGPGAAASASATSRRSGCLRSSASSARSTAPDATSSASCGGSRSYSSRAIANGRAIPAPRPRGSVRIQRSTVAPASGRPPRSRPVTPNRRRIARSWPTDVDARAFGPIVAASGLGPLDEPVERAQGSVIGAAARPRPAARASGRPAARGRRGRRGRPRCRRGRAHRRPPPRSPRRRPRRTGRGTRRR